MTKAGFNRLLLAILQRAVARRDYLVLPSRVVNDFEQVRERDAENRRLLQAIRALAELGSEFEEENCLAAVRSLESIRSQLGQDLFALWSSGTKRNGFFVEFGAGDGVSLSNTFLLERQFGWTGILAEPLTEYHESLRQSRTSVFDPRCVWTESGHEVEFVAAEYLSTISAFRDMDMHAKARSGRGTRSVITISLLDLLSEHGAPREIDFLSIDTEGSEFEILASFPFGEPYTIHAIACEHNYSSNRDSVARLLASKGYRQVGTSVSAHDDWFVLTAR